MKAPTGRRRRVRVVVVSAGVVVLVWLGWCVAVVQTPQLDPEQRVDAVLVLGGLDGTERTDRAVQLATDGLTTTLVISDPNPPGDASTRRACDNPPSGVRVICFKPDPLTTRGEARELGRLAADNGWTRVAVVTSPYHLSRARMIVARCFGGDLVMLSSREHVSPWYWAYQYVYQTAGFVKAEILQGC